MTPVYFLGTPSVVFTPCRPLGYFPHAYREQLNTSKYDGIAGQIVDTIKCLLNAIGDLLKVPYYEKHIFSGLYIYKLVLPEPANSLNEEKKRFLHGLCSPPTGKPARL